MASEETSPEDGAHPKVLESGVQCRGEGHWQAERK